MIETWETQPLPVIQQPRGLIRETPQDRYQRLKQISDRTGRRLLFVYLADERQRAKATHRTRFFPT
jgi:hypothetical protein